MKDNSPSVSRFERGRGQRGGWMWVDVVVGVCGAGVVSRRILVVEYIFIRKLPLRLRFSSEGGGSMVGGGCMRCWCRPRKNLKTKMLVTDY